MSKISLSDFKQTVTREADAQQAQRRREHEDYVVGMRHAVECNVNGVCALLSTALLDTRFDRFTTVIDLGSPNGYLRGLSIRKEDGVWRFHGDERVLRDATAGSWAMTHYSASQADLSHRILDALGIPRSHDAAQRLRDAGAWGGTTKAAADNLRPIGDRVAWHSLTASLGHGSALAQMAGLGHADLGPQWVKAALDLGVDLDACPAPKQPPALVRLAGRDDVGFIKALVEAGASTEVRSDYERTPVAEAVAHGAEQAYAYLVRVRSDLSVVDALNNSLLHLAAQALQSRSPRTMLPFVVDLLRRGVDPDLRSYHGETAYDFVEEAIKAKEQEQYSEDDVAVMREIQEVLEGTHRTLRWR